MKLLKLIFSFTLLSILVLTIYADEINPLVYQYFDPDLTVVFSEPLEVSVSRQQEIADELAGKSSGTILLPTIDSQNNIICTLFGHDIAPQSTVTVTHHKVNKYNPRCLMEVYHVTYCKRCDYTVSELYNDFFIVCCPED